MPWSTWWTSPEKEDEISGPSAVERIQHTVQNVTDTVEKQLPDAPVKSQSGTTIWHAISEPQTIIATAFLTTASLGCISLYRKYFRRIPEAVNIHKSYFRKRSILGRVTSVGDGDNFRIYHTPGGRFAGWGWLPWRRVPDKKTLLKNNTIHIRLAGIDAPELSHFGRPAQPYSQEALDWLTSYVLGRRVRAYVYKLDQYSRVVATVYVRKGLIRRDIGLQMLRAGFATTYEAKTGAEFGPNLEPKYRDAEKGARLRKRGMWAGDMKNYESPREYKRRYS